MLSHAIEVLGWTLLHFVWQGAVVGVLAAATLLALRPRSANARYLTAVSALSLMLLLPIGTIAWLERVPAPEDIAPIVTTTPAIEMPLAREMDLSPLDESPISVERIEFEKTPHAAAVAETKPTRLEEVSEKRETFDVEAFVKPFIPWAVGVWLIGVGVLSLRLFASWLSVLRLRRRATQPASANWQALLGRLAERLRVTRPVKLVESALVEVPAVIGWLRPVILLPASAVTGLTTEQLEALLAHELAHVRRHDYFINLLQTVVETLLFYHPAVWWISRRIRIERERCCDDLAVQACGDRLAYAKALVALEELRAPVSRFALGAADGSLRDRVQRVIAPSSNQRLTASSQFAVVTGCLAIVLVAIFMTQSPRGQGVNPPKSEPVNSEIEPRALGAGLLTPPEKPTEGLPNNAEQKSEAKPRADENDPAMKKFLAICVRDAMAALVDGRLELALEQEFRVKPTAEKPEGDVFKSTATAGWIGEGQKWRVDFDGRILRPVENRFVHEWLPHQWSAGFDGQQHYSWDRDAREIEIGRPFLMALQYSPPQLFWGYSSADLQTVLTSPDTRITEAVHQGLSCFRIEAEHANGPSKKIRVALLLCPERGYLPLEIRTFSESRLDSETQFSDFIELRAGVWAPRKILTKWDDAPIAGVSQTAQQIITTVKRCELSEAAKIQSEEFRVDPPAGTKRIEPDKTGDLRSSEAAGSGDPRRAQELPQGDAEALDALERWRKATDNLASFEADFDRYEYDSVFQVMKRGVGHFRWSGAESWHYELKPFDVPKGKTVTAKQWETGKLNTFQVEASQPEIWTRDGNSLTQESLGKKWSVQIPRESDLPTNFFADLIAAVARGPFAIPPKPQHIEKVRQVEKTGEEIWLQITPNGDERRCYQLMIAILNRKTHLPRAIRMIDPAGTKVTDLAYRSLSIRLRNGGVTTTTQDSTRDLDWGTPVAVEKRTDSLKSRADALRLLTWSDPVEGAGDSRQAQAVNPQNADTAPKAATPIKGQIRWVDPPNSRVWINLGQADGVVRRMKFQVVEKETPKNGDPPPAVKGKIEVLRIIDGHTAEARILEGQNNAVAKGDEVVQLFETTQTNDEPIEGQRKLPPPKGEIYDAARPRNDRVKPNRESGAVSGAISGNRRDRDPKMFDQFTGRVRLKTEKPLPDLEKVVVPAGKVLDESLVFSKDGGLANVFVYLWKPTFKIDELAIGDRVSPAFLFAGDGKFWPRAAIVRVGSPLTLLNSGPDLVDFHAQPLRSDGFNVTVGKDHQSEVAPFKRAESVPFSVKCSFTPWLLAHVLTLDHPFASVTDKDGNFRINGLPPGEHGFRVWHERAGDLEKSLVVTIKPGEKSRSDLDYEPTRFKLEESEIQNWGNRQIKTARGAGLPNDTRPTSTKSTDANEETSGPTQRRGQETRAERDVGQLTGRVRLKTEKPLPNLEQVIVPAGKVLDESLVFSKDGGLANVFVYLQKPTFPIEPPPSNKPPKPFVLIAEGERFWPHASFVRVGRPVVFENRQTEPVNFRMGPLKNVSFNVLVKIQEHVKIQAFRYSEAFPFKLQSDIQPWMVSHLLTLDHPFAAVTDDEGRFNIDGLPPGDHEFHVWHERVGYLEKKLRVTIKAGEPTRNALEYEPSRFELNEPDVLNWGQRQIDSVRNPIPLPRVPRVPAAAPKVEAKRESPDAGAGSGAPDVSAGRGSPDPAPKPTAGLPDSVSEVQAGEKNKPEGDLRSNPAAGSGDPRRAQDDPRRAQAVERAVAFLKSQQKADGSWDGFASAPGAVTSLCVAALLQAGVKPDDAGIQKAIAPLRKIEPAQIYAVALQTMVFCAASPKEDAELIRRNVAWIEKAQVPDGKSRGAWSYALAHGGRGDGSCSRFALLGLQAAKKAGFEVQAETWRRVSDYYLTTQTNEGGWSYAAQGPPSPTMTLAGVAGLATANRYLPQDEQTKTREAAIRKPAEYLEKVIPELQRAPFAFYALHCLERAGHVSGQTQFGKLEWKADMTKRLLDAQGPKGSWSGATAPAVENELIATSLALLSLTGQPEPKLMSRRLRIEPRDAKKPFQVQSSLIENSSPPRHRTSFSGGVRIEGIESDGSKWRIEADRAVIDSFARVNEKFEFTPDSDVTRVVCTGSVIFEGGDGDQLTKVTAEDFDLNLLENSGLFNTNRSLP